MDGHMGLGNPEKQVVSMFVCYGRLAFTDHMLCARYRTSQALKDLSVDCWPVLGVAVHTPNTSAGVKTKSGGSVRVCWALAKKSHSHQQKSRYLIHNVFGKAEAAHHHGASTYRRYSVLHTADTHGVAGNHLNIAIQEGKGPQIDKLNGTKFFPHIQVKSLRHIAFKVSYASASSCCFLLPIECRSLKFPISFQLRYNFGMDAARPMILKPPSSYITLAKAVSATPDQVR